jgi:hypothetical protein
MPNGVFRIRCCADLQVRRVGRPEGLHYTTGRDAERCVPIRCSADLQVRRVGRPEALHYTTGRDAEWCVPDQM